MLEVVDRDPSPLMGASELASSDMTGGAIRDLKGNKEPGMALS